MRPMMMKCDESRYGTVTRTATRLYHGCVRRYPHTDLSRGASLAGEKADTPPPCPSVFLEWWKEYTMTKPTSPIPSLSLKTLAQFLAPYPRNDKIWEQGELEIYDL